MHAHTVVASSSHVCTDKWPPTASTLCSLSHPRKKVQVNGPSAENFLTISGYFEHYMYCVKVLHCRLAEKRRNFKKEIDEQF